MSPATGGAPLVALLPGGPLAGLGLGFALHKLELLRLPVREAATWQVIALVDELTLLLGGAEVEVVVVHVGD